MLLDTRDRHPRLTYGVLFIIVLIRNLLDTPSILGVWTGSICVMLPFITPWTIPTSKYFNRLFVSAIGLGGCVLIGFVRTVDVGDCIHWNCPGNWFRRLSMKWNCPDNWFRQSSINCNCPDNGLRTHTPSICWNCVSNRFRVFMNWICLNNMISETVNSLELPRRLIWGAGPLSIIVQTIDLGCCLFVGIVSTIDFGCYLLNGIVQAIHFGCCPLNGIVHTIDFGGWKLIGIVRTISFRGRPRNQLL